MESIARYGRKALHRTATGLVAAFNRADEVGGEVRDFIQDKVLRDPRYVALRKKVDAARGKDYHSRQDGEVASAAAAAHAAAMAPAPGASVAVADDALGNPELSAQIYGRTSCPWTGRAITLLEKRKVDYDYVDLDDDELASRFETRLVAETKQNTVPYVFVRGDFIGGFNALDELERLGQLEVALLPAAERGAQRNAAKVEVSARPSSDEVAPGEQ